MMTEAHIGRLLAPCLHQAILDVVPQRLEFYEHWLRSEGLRDGSIGLAPTTAVLGFLRTEGDNYDRVMARAGRLAAEWTIDVMSAFRRRCIGWLPRPLRARAALRVAASIVRSVCSTSRASARVRRGHARFVVRRSLFCAVREAQSTPLCGFYAALAVETLTRLGVPAAGRVIECSAVAGTRCTVTIRLAEAETIHDPALAA
jgi:predicted hydrocarbon binding protein